MAITNKEEGVWGLDQVYNKINQGGIWQYTSDQVALWSWGYGTSGQLGLNQGGTVRISSPTQIGGTTWSDSSSNISVQGRKGKLFIKTDGTLWFWGGNQNGQSGIVSLPQNSQKSSPIQVGTDTTWKMSGGAYGTGLAVKTDGTAWSWGYNQFGGLGLNNRTKYSSPTQIGTDTTWDSIWSLGYGGAGIKTNGTLWTWGLNSYGQLGLNSVGSPIFHGKSSPTQVGTDSTWARLVTSDSYAVGAMKTDGTAWGWGANSLGGLGLNNRTWRSSPTQIPGTWSFVDIDSHSIGVKTDGTLWTWGDNHQGQLGHNQSGGTDISSPTQVPGTWSTSLWNASAGGAPGGDGISAAIKSDGTLWAWGYNFSGQLGQNQGGNNASYSSPVQIGSGSDYLNVQCTNWDSMVIAMAKL